MRSGVDFQTPINFRLIIRCGDDAGVTSDQTWESMVEIADRLTAEYCRDDTLEVVASRQLRWLWMVEGLYIGDLWTDVWVPVRRRWLFRKRWRTTCPIPEAAARAESFLVQRPDLR